MTDAALALRKLDIEALLLPVLVQLAVVIAAARVCGGLARRVGQPAVVGEVLAGLALGPSLLGWLAPDLSAAVFRPHLHGLPDDLAGAVLPKVIQVIAQLGLVLLLFLVGLEFEFHHLKAKGAAAAAVSLAGVALPFALGVGLAPLLYPHLTGEPVPRLGFTLFLGVALSITAMPVLGRILIELGVTRTRLATVVITAAAIDDAVGWVLLASVAALARAEFDPRTAAGMVGLTGGFVAAMLLAVRPLLGRALDRSLRANGGELSLNALAGLLVAVLMAAAATNRIGIFAVFGAFLVGAAVGDVPGLRAAVTARLRDFVTVFLLPVFFTYTGLRTDLGSLSGPAEWAMCGAVTAAAVVGKLGGCGLAARLTGFPAREAAVVGALMSTRGLMALVVANVGYDLGVIPRSVFTALVVMAVLTTIMTTPLVLLLRRGTELEEPIRASGFLRRGGSV